MLLDLAPFETVTRGNSSLKQRALSSVVDILRRKLGVLVGFDTRSLPYQDPSLIEPAQLADLLRDAGVILNVERGSRMNDEPPLFMWLATCNIPTKHRTGGSSFESDKQAWMASLAEAVERYIWFSKTDYFIDPTYATEAEIRKKGACISPSAWASFSETQRSERPERVLRPDAEYLWVRAESLVSGTPVYIPAQTISGARGIQVHHGVREPHVRNQNTIGLATWPTQIGARLAGAMEVIEREAYMIMWLNQLVLPRINLQPLCDEHPSLAKLIETCARYRMRVHAIRMLTDVPTHAVCVVLEDLSGHAPRFAVGLKANRSLVYAIEKSINEALRARRGYRNYFMQGNTWDASTPVADIGHRERLYYWGAKPEGLDVLISGAEETVPHMPWDNDTTEQHYDRIIQWCAQKGFECVSVALTRSPSNPTPFHIEMVALPDLVPTHLRENERAFGAERIRSVPEAFGYQPLDEPFTDSPHPFS